MSEAQMEICLLWGDWQIQQWWSCMTRSEWASWAQAVGVIAAMFIPLFVALSNKYRNKKISIKLIDEVNYFQGIIIQEISFLRGVNDDMKEWVLRDSLDFLSQIKTPSEERLEALAKLDIDLAMNIKMAFSDAMSKIDRRTSYFESSNDLILASFAKLLLKDLNILDIRLIHISKSLHTFKNKPFWMLF